MTSDLKERRRFKFIASTRNEENADDVLLCHECALHLTVEDKKDSVLCKNAWPGFFWSVLSNVELHEEYGQAIWKFVPKQWRYWWLAALKYSFPTMFHNISISEPEPCFIDRTIEMNDFDSRLNSYSLGNLIEASNKHLMPLILCPWGCSEYYHR